LIEIEPAGILIIYFHIASVNIFTSLVRMTRDP